MKALLRLIPLEAIVQWLLLRLQGITAEQWRRAIDAVVHAAKAFSDSETKARFVRDAIKVLWPRIATSALNWLVETAVAFSKSRGLIR